MASRPAQTAWILWQLLQRLYVERDAILSDREVRLRPVLEHIAAIRDALNALDWAGDPPARAMSEDE